jgi:hypothetical protein
MSALETSGLILKKTSSCWIELAIPGTLRNFVRQERSPRRGLRVGWLAELWLESYLRRCGEGCSQLEIGFLETDKDDLEQVNARGTMSWLE